MLSAEGDHSDLLRRSAKIGATAGIPHTGHIAQARTLPSPARPGIPLVASAARTPGGRRSHLVAAPIRSAGSSYTKPARAKPSGTNGHKSRLLTSPPRGRKPRHQPETSRLPGLSEAGATGLEPATSGVTGRRSNQLSYAPKGARTAPGGSARYVQYAKRRADDHSIPTAKGSASAAACSPASRHARPTASPPHTLRHSSPKLASQPVLL